MIPAARQVLTPEGGLMPVARYATLTLYKPTGPYRGHRACLSTPLALLTPLPLKIAVDSAPGLANALALDVSLRQGARILTAPCWLSRIGLVVAISLLMHLQALGSLGHA